MMKSPLSILFRLLRRQSTVISRIKLTFDKDIFRRSIVLKLIARENISYSDLSIFCRLTGIMFTNGESFRDSVAIASSLFHRSHTKLIFSEVAKRLESGFTFTQAIAPFSYLFPKDFIRFCDFSDQHVKSRGEMTETLMTVARYCEKQAHAVPSFAELVILPFSLSLFFLILTGCGILFSEKLVMYWNSLGGFGSSFLVILFVTIFILMPVFFTTYHSKRKLEHLSQSQIALLTNRFRRSI